MKTRKEIIYAHKDKYQKSTKKERGQLLNSICESTGLSRDRAARLLREEKTREKIDLKKENRGRKPKYNAEVIKALNKIWGILDFACGKRLKEGIKPLIEALERHDEMVFNPEIKSKLFDISAASIDRLLASHKKELAFKGKSTTKPGTLLKKNIPLRLGTQWNDAIPGYVEIDLVAHCGDTTAGEYVNTLDVTDICTGWTETYAVLNKAQIHVFNALITIESNLPFKYHGIDSDNGSEFINDHLYKYCENNNICFTRSRPYQKNDNCHVEQKNWAIVRRNIGYNRYEGIKATKLLNEYYHLLRYYTNFFLPQTKIISRTRKDSKIIKKYQIPKTPYQRILESDIISESIKKELKVLYLTLNPLSIKRDMIKILENLEKLAIPSYHSRKVITPNGVSALVITHNNSKNIELNKIYR